ncbi:MAG: TIR domain-containing protein [Aeromicrobium sp.]
MARASFVSFHYQNDYWRVQQVLKIGAIEGESILPAQNWESVKAKGDQAIHDWIDAEMAYKAAVVVLIGSDTASRKFVKYEIKKAWSSRKPLLGIHINELKDANQATSSRGANPFAQFGFSNSTKTYADYVPVFTPSGSDSTQVYADIRNNIGRWLANGYKQP